MSDTIGKGVNVPCPMSKTGLLSYDPVSFSQVNLDYINHDEGGRLMSACSVVFISL